MHVIDGVSANGTERTAKMSYYTGLLAIVNDIVTHDMTADIILMPISAKCVENNFLFPLRTAFIFSCRTQIVSFIKVFTKAYANTLCFKNMVLAIALMK